MIDVSSWKEFKISDIFEINLAKGDLQAQKLPEGSIPLVSSGMSNNGICKYVEETSKSEMFESKSITVDMFGKVFFQNSKFYAVGHGRVNILSPKKPLTISEPIGLFIATIIEKKTSHKYMFKDLCSSSVLKEELIKLPVDSSDNIDWQYMENYIMELTNQTILLIDELLSISSLKCFNHINTCNWQSFKVEDLFYKLDLKILNPNFNKKIDVSQIKTEEFSLPLVNAKHYNNGIMFYGRESDFEASEMTIDVVKNGAIATGDIFPQPQKTGVLWDAYLIKSYNEIKSDKILIFLATILRKTIKDKFSYNDKCIWDKVKKLTLKLPVNEENIPNWNYMEYYIKFLNEKVARTLNNLAK